MAPKTLSRTSSKQSLQKGRRKPAPRPESESESESEIEQSDEQAQQEDDSSEVSESDSEQEEKDQMELDLEKLVFGDKEGFREGIKSFGVEGRTSGQDVDMDEDAEELEDEAGLGSIADADLFFIDAGPSDGTSKSIATHEATEDEQELQGRREPPAWEDSDDDRIMVSLASAPRLRKLRRTEAEDVVSGKEYTRRLRMQFERLNPPPAWAQPPKPKKKRRKSRAASSDDTSGEDTDVDEDLSTQPLAKLLQDSSALTRWQEERSNKRRKLGPEKIAISRLKDVPGEQPSAIASLSFHPTYPLLLSSGIAKTVWLHHIYPYPPIPNPLLTSLHMKGVPLDTASFHPDPSESKIFLSSRRRYYHVWDLPSGRIERADQALSFDREQRSMAHFLLSPNGKYIAFRATGTRRSGAVTILSAVTSQWLCQARIEGEMADFAWWADGNGLTIVGTGGEVSEYSVTAERFLAVWHDEGALNTTKLALGGRSGRDDFFGGDRWIAIGSKSGIVNVYDRRAWLSSKALKNKRGSSSSEAAAAAADFTIPPHPTPLRTLDHLVTPISTLTFAHDGQILLMASSQGRNALRLVHLPSATIYQNWPTAQTPLGRVTAACWGKGEMLEEGEGEGEGASGRALYVLAVGNDRGKIGLWEVGL